MNEELLRCRSDPSFLLSSGNELGLILRHPKLDKPYYQEVFEAHAAWKDLITKSIIYDEYFSSECSDALARFLTALLNAAKGRPLIQECRTSNRIGAIKKSIEGIHLYLWRNPWDQWWSFKCAEYFDTGAQMIINAPVHPLVITRLRAEIGFVEFHDSNIVDEMKYFEMRRLSADDSYLAIFTLWCLAWFEAQKHADLCINIDRLTESGEYRDEVLLNLDRMGVHGLDFSDCKIHHATYVSKDQHFFQRNEDRAFGILLSAGIPGSNLDKLCQVRQEALPVGHLVMSDPSISRGVLEDAARARDVALRTETASASRIRYLIMEWGQTVAREINLNHEVSVSRDLLDEVKRETSVREKTLQEEWSAKFEAARRESQIKVRDLLARERSTIGQSKALAERLQTQFIAAQQQSAEQWDARLRAVQEEARSQVEAANTREQEAQVRNADLTAQIRNLAEHLQMQFIAAQHQSAEQWDARLRAVQEEARSQVEAANTREQEAQVRNADLTAQIRNLAERSQILLLESQHAKGQAEREAHDHNCEKERMLREIETARTAALKLESELANVLEQMKIITDCWSWKLTRPLRWLKGSADVLSKKAAKKYTPVTHDQLDTVDVVDARHIDRSGLQIIKTNYEISTDMATHFDELFDLHGVAFITAAYRIILGRAPDSEGMHYYRSRLAQGYGKASILLQLSQSEEARKLTEIGERPDLDDEAFIATAYWTLLRRAPDEDGKSHYLQRLRSGKTRRSVVADISNSPESKNRHILHLAELEAKCAEERKANNWLLSRFLRGKRLERQINRLGYELGATAQRLASMIQQNQTSTEALLEQSVAQFEQWQRRMRQIPIIEQTKSIQPAQQSNPDQVAGSLPKILHRVYFTNYPPFYDPFQHYLETWKLELPQYQIMKWGPDNVDTSANEWMRRSAESNDPVFLSEFVRWDALKKYGGVYLDSDCEVLSGEKFNALVEELMIATNYDAFVGVEEFYNGHPTAQTIAAKKGATLVDFMHELYSGPLSGPLWHWRAERGLIGPQLISLYFREHGMTETKGFPIQLKEPVIVGRVKIYPQEYFSPKFTTTGKKLAVTENTCIYHLFANLNVKDVDPEAEMHRNKPLLFNEYCDYLAEQHEKVVALNRDSSIRKLHRIYFGFDGKPDPYRRYLDTWVKHMQGYEICHWNAANLPLDNCQFSRMMYELKDHAFLSDYFRWWILREHGGVYLDADVEIINGELLDKLIAELNDDEQIHSFIGIDSKADGWFTAHSMACKKGSPLAKFMCEVYEGMGHLSLWRRKVFYFMAPQLTSLYFASHGWNVDGMGSTPNLQTPVVVGGVKIFPQEWFSPMRPQMKDGIGGFEIDSYTEKTCLCHHFSCSWHSDDSPYRKNRSGMNTLLLNELIR